MCDIKKFCCGCTLRHGAITAAILNVIDAVGMIAAGAQILHVTSKTDNSFLPYSGSQQMVHQDMNIRKIIGGGMLAIGFLSLVVFICLVVGIRKGIAGFIMPWLIGFMIYIILLCITMVTLIIYEVYIMLNFVLLIAFYIYLWIVVFNFYREIRDGSSADISVIKA